jgi:hypothetical protein
MILQEPTDDSLPGIPHLDYDLTPITDLTFERQGWTKLSMGDDISNEFYVDDEIDMDILLNSNDKISKEELEEMFKEMDDFPYHLNDTQNDFSNNDSKNPLKPFMSGDDEDDDEDHYDDAYFWVLKLPRDSPLDFREDCPILMSTVSDEVIDGLVDGEYMVQLFSPFELGVCRTEEEIEILYRALTGMDIYDF